MYIRFKDGKQRALTLSYDDGVIFDKRLIEIMDKHGLKGTFNINSGMYFPEDGEMQEGIRRVKKSEALELYKNSGHEIAVHALTHPFLDQMEDGDIMYQIIEDRKNLEQDYGAVVRGMAYPYGTYNDRVIDVLKKCGVVYSRTVKSTESFDIPENWLELNPTCHHKTPRLMEIANAFFKGERWDRARLFYLWGHSYEFYQDDNWNVIEEFAEFMGGRDDVWYATNIEIYDYVQAYKSLQVSYDGRIIRNPSATDVWVYINGETLMIKSGETLYR